MNFCVMRSSPVDFRVLFCLIILVWLLSRFGFCHVVVDIMNIGKLSLCFSYSWHQPGGSDPLPPNALSLTEEYPNPDALYRTLGMIADDQSGLQPEPPVSRGKFLLICYQISTGVLPVCPLLSTVFFNQIVITSVEFGNVISEESEL